MTDKPKTLHSKRHYPDNAKHLSCPYVKLIHRVCRWVWEPPYI